MTVGSMLHSWPRGLKIAAAAYALWLAWLVYVAWVNVAAGNP